MPDLPVSREIELISDHVAALSDLEAAPPPISSEELAAQRAAWTPSLNPTQLDIYNNETARYIMAYGERASGKSVAMLHKIVKHCYNEFNALAAIIVGIKRTALEGGAWHKVVYDILPQWKVGVGLEYTESKQNSAKDDYLYISNKYGGWSKLILISMPVESFVRERARGLEMGAIFVDEASTLGSDVYFSALVQQLGRRPNVVGEQQYLCATNPEGPSHWLYKRFFEKPRREDGTWDNRYATYHVPIAENVDNLPPGYYDNVIQAVADDEVEYKRLVEGVWLDRPTGDSVFKNYYSSAIHVRGNAIDGTRILPQKGSDIILGFDLGTANSAVVFMQNLITREQDIFTVFDEAVYIDAYIPYTLLVPALMRRINFWNETVGTKFNVVCISDSSAFHQFRATDGTYDNYEIERLSREAVKSFPGLDPLKVLPAPRFNGSVAARVKTTMKYLQQERLLISDSCQRVKDMFMKLEMEKAKPGKYLPELPFQPARSKHLHSFDALSYVLLFQEMGYTAQTFKDVSPPEMVPMGTIRR